MEIRYYTEEIKEFILSLDKKSSSDIDRLILLLHKCGNEMQSLERLLLHNITYM